MGYETRGNCLADIIQCGDGEAPMIYSPESDLWFYKNEVLRDPEGEPWKQRGMQHKLLLSLSDFKIKTYELLREELVITQKGLDMAVYRLREIIKNYPCRVDNIISVGYRLVCKGCMYY